MRGDTYIQEGDSEGVTKKETMEGARAQARCQDWSGVGGDILPPSHVGRSRIA